MQNKIANTLFIPLIARIHASKNFKQYFYDETAMKFEDKIPQKFLKISSEYESLASAARYYETDIMIKDFIATHSVCNVVNLGCGLETLAFRFGKNGAKFYGVDLAEVIEFRQNLLPQNDNETLISCDMFDMKWTEILDKSLPTIFVANGVFMYFCEKEILNLISNLKANFKNSELIFDATTKFGIRCANFYVSRFGENMAKMEFFVQNGGEFAGKCECEILSKTPFFATARKMLKNKTKLSTRLTMAFVDKFDLAFILRLNLRKK
ncbi:class I SAM-dependent methyltransferase [Campylobacter sp. JMF_06 NA1]|uniref:class I SAM-dependent methyltransferase n=1 Tax=Campylobacter sp. JMF_06 NA1 TaxID=2983823 RepID=UPI0022E9BE44|nr:class I SAM-dependent methyltransferase [Campylobacter sp. JMF_06 NA1]MDA3078652.1 class I SAM-dependent methyltransferase [Campylobacter sp. JMF_06 NA1]